MHCSCHQLKIHSPSTDGEEVLQTNARPNFLCVVSPIIALHQCVVLKKSVEDISNGLGGHMIKKIKLLSKARNLELGHGGRMSQDQHFKQPPFGTLHLNLQWGCRAGLDTQGEHYLSFRWCLKQTCTHARTHRHTCMRLRRDIDEQRDDCKRFLAVPTRIRTPTSALLVGSPPT